MTHCSDDDLVLQYYGESPEADAHVGACAACAGRARDLAELLQSVDGDVPSRDERYGAEVFYRIRARLEPRRSWLARLAEAFREGGRSAALRWSLAAAATIVLIASAFFAGRISMRPVDTAAAVAPAEPTTDVADPEFARRVLLLTVADHLERSDRVLTDIMNMPGADISAEQQWADDLIAANRLYRQDALAADESSVADVLDELERALLDIVHRPADAPHADLDQIRERIDSAALLFKVRVLTNELRQRQFSSDAPTSTRSTTPVS
jgi:hypothetical protein